MKKPKIEDFHKISPSVHGIERIIREHDAYLMYAYALEDYIKYIEQKYVGETSDDNVELPLHGVKASVPNREFKGILKAYSGFTHSNRNILQVEVAGVENYIGNTLKVGDEVNIQHWC